MKILLLGGNGFIGRNLLEGLKDDYSILAPSHRQLDLTNSEAVKQYFKSNKIDVIVNCAVGKDRLVLPQTLIMFANLINNFSRVEKFIHFGSGAEYDKTRDMIKIKEKDWGKRIPSDDNGLAKYLTCQMIKHDKKFINLRLFGIYGKYENYRYKFISNSIVKNLLGLPIKIKQDTVFDYLWIGDLIPIVKYFLNHSPKYSDYNITPNQSISLKQIAKIINTLAKKKSKIIIVNQGFNFQYTGDNSRLKQALPQLKFTSHQKATADLYNYYQKIIDQIDKKAILEDQYFTNCQIRKLSKSK